VEIDVNWKDVQDLYESSALELRLLATYFEPWFCHRISWAFMWFFLSPSRGIIL